MILSSLLPLAIFAASVLAEANVDAVLNAYGHGERVGHDDERIGHGGERQHPRCFKDCHKHCEKVQVGGGWERFTFGNVGSTESFCFQSKQSMTLKITDYFCTGDKFAVYDNGVHIGDTSPTHFDECKTSTGDADFAFEHGAWSSLSYALAPGHHNVTIKVLASPYKEGYGAIRVDSVYYKCCYSQGGLTLVDTPVPFCEAEAACRAFGMKLADVDVYNFNAATQVVFGCGGQFASAYIKSYWGNTYHDSCLALYTGSAAPGGSISTPVNCDKHMPVLCQGKTSSCSSHFLRA